MLQQTRASVVVPYYLKWMKLFPYIKTLALAPINTVIKAWEGLGYYSRARNLHRGARQILEEFNGNMPKEEKGLLQIKGIGPYTVSAILAFAYGEKKAAVDGNVRRFLSRYFLIEEEITKISVQKQIHTIAQDLVLDAPYPISEAMIEFGALICAPSPKCHLCPLKSCLAKKFNAASRLPLKMKKIDYIDLQRVVFIIRHKDQCLVRKNSSAELMGDLYEFPYEDVTGKWDIASLLKERNIDAETIKKMKKLRQSFTKYKAVLHPFYIFIRNSYHYEDFTWISFQEIDNLAFSSGHRKIIKEMDNENFTS